MSKYFNQQLDKLAPYIPGEQPQQGEWIKLNTNESPFPPAPGVFGSVGKGLELYPDPESTELVKALASRFGLEKEQVMVGNGSDELLAFSFMAFQQDHGVFYFPDVTYGFYPVYASLFAKEGRTIPLTEDWRVRPEDYQNLPGTIVLANPNAPTGRGLSRKEIQGILQQNSQRVVIIDEAYVDFGGESAVPLIPQYDNLLVMQTFSKSRNLAGARVGVAMGHRELIQDLKRIQYSFNPYNLNRLSQQAALAALEDDAYFQECVRKIIEMRRWTEGKLQEMGLVVMPSQTNFLMVDPVKIEARRYHQELKKRGILIRYFGGSRLEQQVRITIGTENQMQQLVGATIRIWEEIS
jgi:histidinol-phosphate aminotransferase